MACRVFGGGGGYTLNQAYRSGHEAVDLGPGNGSNSDIVAHSAGEVVWCQSGYGNAQGSSGNASYGNAVKLRHSGGCDTLYAHLSYVSVSQGQQVGRGQKLGAMGNTGNSYGAHLHFEVQNRGGGRLNPTPYIGADLPGFSGGGSSSSGNKGSASSTPKAPPKVEITEVKVVSVQGQAGVRAKDALAEMSLVQKGCEILVQNGANVYVPVLLEKVSVEWSRKNTPGVLTFTCLQDKALQITEGNAVRFRYEGEKVFYGYIFEKSESGKAEVTVTCYDQLRYLKNKTALAYSGKTYSTLLKELAGKYRLRLGTVEDSKCLLPRCIEDGTLFDILGNASDETLFKTGNLFVLYDDFGKLCLRKIDSLFVPILIEEGSAGGYTYTSSIDKNVYTKITLAKDNDLTGVRELYVANNQGGQSAWGVLEYYEAQNHMSSTELKETAALLAKYYGKKKRALSLQNCFGDVRVRGGSSLVVYLQVNDKKIRNVMVVEKVRHSFAQGLHTMDVDLAGIGGEFSV